MAINNAIWEVLDELLKTYNVIHICGKDKTDSKYNGKEGYAQFEYVKSELSDLFTLADIVISRAGANAICELLALKKLNILIPLSLKASRGDQILNAESFQKSGYSYVIDEENLNKDTLLKALTEIEDKKEEYITAMEKSKVSDSITTITSQSHIRKKQQRLLIPRC